MGIPIRTVFHGPITPPNLCKLGALYHRPGRLSTCIQVSACRKSATLQGGPFSACCTGQKTSWLRCPVFAAPVAAGLQKADRGPCSASAASAAGSASALQSPGIPLLDKIKRRTAHSSLRPRTLSALNFPGCVPAVRTCRSAGTFLTVCNLYPRFSAFTRAARPRGRPRWPAGPAPRR